MKQIKHFLLTVAMLLCSTSCFAAVDYDFKVDGICYDITSETDNTVRVTYNDKAFSYDYNFYTKYSGTVTIPEYVTYNGTTYSVTSIGNYAFYCCYGLTSVTIPNSVTSIGNFAFYYCDDLKEVHISDIAAWCNIYFYNDMSNPLVYADHLYVNGEEVTDLVIPEGVTAIKDFAFSHYGLTSVTIPNSVTSIGSYAFSGCSLKSLTIGTGVLSIGSNQSKPVKTIWLTNTPPSGYKNLKGNINYVANDQYSELSNVRVYPYLSSAFETDGVKYVPVSPAERTCDAIDCSYDSTVVDINIGETVSFKGVEMKVQKIMPYIAYGQKFIKKVSVSNKGVLGYNAFYGCTGITDATISNDGNIGESAFEGAMTSDNAVLKVSNKGDIYPKAFYGCTALETLTLGENVTSIGGSAFRGCSKLLAVTIPNKTTSLSSYSFDGCSSMKTLKIGDGIVTIPEDAFSGCSSLSSVEWGKSVEKIERYSFNGCSALPSIDIPASVTSVGDYTFKGCTSLADVVIKDRTTDLSLGSNGSSPLFADCPLDYVYVESNSKCKISLSSRKTSFLAFQNSVFPSVYCSVSSGFA